MDDQIFQLQPGIRLATLDVSSHAATYLAQLPNRGQLQVSERLYHLLSCLETPKSISALAEAFFQRTGVAITEDVVRQVVTQVLLPRGLIISEIESATSGFVGAVQPGTRSEPTQRPKGSLLALHFKKDVLPATVLTPLTHVLQSLYNPLLATVLILMVLLLQGFAYWHIRIQPQFGIQGVSWPLVYVLFVFSVLVHELGHVSACRRWQCEHGSLGVALYFFMPAFYVDVSHTWRLPRWQRLVVDLGGIYFQLVFTLGLIAAFWLTQRPTYLWTMFLIDVTLLVNLNPMLKLDGYWVLSDLFGVANLHKRSWELLRFGATWLVWKLRLRSHPPILSVFGQFQPAILFGVAWYTTLAINLWMLTLALMIPLLIRVATTYPAVAFNAVTALRVALPMWDVSLMFVAVDSLFLPTLMLLNLVLLLRRIGLSLLHTAMHVTRKLYAYS